MGTRADFYIGRTKEAEWLGSIAYDGYPEGIDDVVKGAQDEDTFAQEVARMLADDESGTTPDLGWPWPWEDSGTTDYAYAFDGGCVWVSNYDSNWVPVSEYDPEKENRKDDAPTFPQFGTEDTTLGPRSGLIVFGLPSE